MKIAHVLALLLVLFTTQAATAGCISNALAKLLRTKQTTMEAMQGDVTRAVENGRLRIVQINRAGEGTPTATTLGPDIIEGRYYAAVMQPDGSLAIGEYDSLHGGHTALARATGVPVIRKLDRDGAAAGGVIFTKDGVLVSGKSVRYPDQKSANELAAALRRMGIRVKLVTADSIKETNKPLEARSSGAIHLMRTGP